MRGDGRKSSMFLFFIPRQLQIQPKCYHEHVLDAFLLSFARPHEEPKQAKISTDA